jgi:hypothetical protein
LPLLAKQLRLPVIALGFLTAPGAAAAQSRVDTLYTSAARPVDIGELGEPGGAASDREGFVVIDRDRRIPVHAALRQL